MGQITWRQPLEQSGSLCHSPSDRRFRGMRGEGKCGTDYGVEHVVTKKCGVVGGCERTHNDSRLTNGADPDADFGV
jgi:hypothetical protein